ncbi:MAG: ParA family protein [Rhodobacteraceae bacterium]|nr:ParA family protein [Paracoccaceae bacterium]
MAKGKIITIAQQKGGAGKTTLAVTLGVALAREGLRVALLDTDPQGSLGRWFMTRRAALPDPGLAFGTASAWGVGYECEKLRGEADVVIVDTPPKADSDLRPALREADLVLVPVASSHVDLWATEGVLDLARRAGKPALIVLNRARARTRLGAEVAAAAQELDAELAEVQIANRVVHAQSLGAGLSALEVGGGAPVRAEIAALCTLVRARLGI